MDFDLNALIDPIVHQLVNAAVTAISTLLVALVFQLLRRLNLKLTEETEARLNRLGEEAALLAEERVEALVKRGTVAAAEAGKRKLQEAIGHLSERSPGLYGDQAHALITKALPKLGLGASSAPPNKPAAVVRQFVEKA